MNPSFAIRIAASLALCAAAGAHADATASISYVGALDSDAALLVDWNDRRATAHLVLRNGQSDAGYTQDGEQRLVTLATPTSQTFDSVDDCGEAVSQTVTIDQLVFRFVRGSERNGRARIVEIGRNIVTGGCAPGTTPYGSPDDPGYVTNVVDMSERASMADLVPGAMLAGMTETPIPLDDFLPLVTEQVVTFGTDSVTFQSTGDVVPASTSDGWIVLDFGATRLGYTRLTRNAGTGVESWLMAPWVDGAPAAVHNVMAVEPNAAAGFGTHGQAAHRWAEGLFKNSDPRLDWDLYSDSTGAFIQRAVDGSFQNSTPLTWAQPGANLVIKRSSDFTVSYRQRTWVPLANYGLDHFVMESEDLYDADGGFVANVILPRVDYFVDHGPAVKPMRVPRAD